MDHHLARQLLKENGYSLSGIREDGSWTASASAIALIAMVNLDFELNVNADGFAIFGGTRSAVEGEGERSLERSGSLGDMMDLAVSTLYRAARA